MLTIIALITATILYFPSRDDIDKKFENIRKENEREIDKMSSDVDYIRSRVDKILDQMAKKK